MKNEEYVSLTELGKLYGVSSHKVGRWLKDMGLRESNGKPSQEAFDQNLVEQRPSTNDGTYFYVWHRDRTIEELEMT